MRGRVLIIAGSDSGGGAGIQADIKSCAAMDAYSATAITALTAQDTLGVHGVHPVPTAFIRQQIRLSLRDIGADAIKTGMLGDAATIDAVCDALAEDGRGIPLVADPVMVAKGGSNLLAPDAVETLKRRLLPFAAVLTPNIPEAEVLSGMRIAGLEDMRAAAEMMLTLGVPAVLLKGGHLEGRRLLDLLATENGTEVFESPRVETRHTHGTGCTLASAIAAGLAQGMGLRDAVVRGRAFVQVALRAAPGLGRGHGPLNHGVTVDPARIAALS
ncbi:MAG: bifunctional hydroxymethylpyrimidine kinase/phosphomethylpyrimidine kinase [Roseomonas sp.]|nr:bifunctional hydroxymethylpyrimidine kinase/phosphomethylpyrimidine kinase [Roseomonas sp.]